MIQRGEQTFKIAATLGNVEVGQDLEGVTYMGVHGWFPEPEDMTDFTNRIGVMFGRPDAFVHPDMLRGPFLGEKTSLGHLVHDVSRWPYFGVEALLRSIGVQHDEAFSDAGPSTVEAPGSRLRQRQRIQFSSIALIGRPLNQDEAEIIFTQPLINRDRIR